VPPSCSKPLGSRYCALAHTAVLRERFYSDAELRTILVDGPRVGLDAADAAAVDFAERIAADPDLAGPQDIERLRSAGLSEVDIMQIVLTVAVRRFFTAVLHATGTEADTRLETLDPALRAAVVG
jgi:alkylhydroperoxidase family enzyme